jgi:two-component system CheB/CheR fusion protein
LRALLEHSLDACALVEPDGTVSFVSSSIIRVLGYTPEEFTALNAFEPIHPDERDAAVHRFALIVQQPGGSQTALNRVRHKNGLWRWIETVSTNQLCNPSVRAIVANFRDVTDRRRIEAALREREEHFRLIVESATDFAIFTVSLDGRITSWNVGAERILGYTEDEIVGEHLRIVFTPEDNAAGRGEFEMSRAFCDGHENDDRWHMRKGGIRFWASGIMMPLKDEAGEIKGFLKILRDRTERKLAHEALEEAERRKDEFLAALGHELRNPLAAISNAVQLLLRASRTEDLAWIKDVIGRQTKQLARLVNDLIDVNRVTRGTIPLHEELTDLAGVIARAVEVARPLIDAKNQHFSVSIVPSHVMVSVDPARLEQVLVNLLENAAKYTEREGHIALTAQLNGEVIVTVKDDGIGIPRDLLSNIFDLFVQGERPIDRSQGGLGIGLALVKKLVELHRGTVNAASEGVGKGSEFTIRLPAVPNGIEYVPRPGSGAPAQIPKGLRVLVAEDNPDTAAGLTKVLLASGTRVTTARDGPTVLEVARNERPDVILMDIGLPGIDGYTVAEQLRREEGNKNVILIAISGYGREQDLRRSRDAGFDHHLVKPVDHEVLFSLLARSSSPATT